MRRRTLLAALPGSISLAGSPRREAAAAYRFRLAISRRGDWDTCVAEMGARSGVFDRYRVAADIQYTRDSDETLDAVLSRHADIGIGVDTLAVMAAFADGGAIRIFANGTTGVAELFWYVAAESPIRTIRDCNGKTMAFASPGSATHSAALGLAATFRITPRLQASGGVQATFDQVLARELDVGWSAAPHGLEAAGAGQIRILAYGSNVASLRGRTMRVQIAHEAVLRTRGPALDWFMLAYRETLEWMYTSPEAVRALATFADIPPAMVARLRTDFFPRQAIWPDGVAQLEAVMEEGVRLGVLAEPLSLGHMAELVQMQRGGAGDAGRKQGQGSALDPQGAGGPLDPFH